MRQRNQRDLADAFKVILNSILNDIIHIDDKLLKFVESLMNMVEIRVNVH